jgi:ferritin
MDFRRKFNAKRGEIMLNERVEEALNLQLNKEMYSSYLYLAMSAYSSYVGLPDLPTGLKSRSKKKESTQ